MEAMIPGLHTQKTKMEDPNETIVYAQITFKNQNKGKSIGYKIAHFCFILH
jgi:hypothetical protein